MKPLFMGLIAKIQLLLKSEFLHEKNYWMFSMDFFCISKCE